MNIRLSMKVKKTLSIICLRFFYINEISNEINKIQIGKIRFKKEINGDYKCISIYVYII